MSCKRYALFGLFTMAGLFLFGSCCEDQKLEVSELDLRLRGGYEASIDVEFDWDMQFEWDWDWSGWSHIDASASQSFEFDGEEWFTFENHVDADVDDDGVDESVNLIAIAEHQPTDPERIYVTWRGDEYSFDAGMCYLLWWEGTTTKLLMAHCGRQEPAIACEMRQGRRGSLDCGACNELGVCVDCGEQQKVSECIDLGAEELPNESNAKGGQGGGAGQGEGGSSGQTGQSGSAGEGEGGSSGQAGTAGAAGDITVTTEWSLCVAQVDSLRDDAEDCNRDNMLQTEELCRNRLSDVDLCYLAVEAGGLFVSACSVMDQELACGSLFP